MFDADECKLNVYIMFSNIYSNTYHSFLCIKTCFHFRISPALVTGVRCVQDWAARYWVQKGAPKDKLNIGMGLYGRSFTLASASNHQPGAPAPHPGQPGPFTGDGGVLAYYEVPLGRDRTMKEA